ncbi:tRNA 2-thiouridine(34) synthase MnmA [Candidatus Saccharibacteria bacterium]|nr:MAG: tRNA 2-thiouridine(34) synthase MnmA [Candidatus Saccharibacteria bacterium]
MRVFVGMSGGVDSSLAAALLVEQGHDVTGIYMKNWSQDLPGMRCPWAEDLADAKRVAVQLGIDFKVYDFEAEYKQRVVDYMIAEYQAGRTPNPDIMCNQEVKFKLFLETALDDGADMIATGHYARVENGMLKCAKDTDKDQTYFLGRVSGDALKKVLFPLGNILKSDVRNMAAQRGLWTAKKAESMGVCFVGNVGMREFLGQYVETCTGPIIDEHSKKVVGQHDGAILYTLGQRHGLDVGGGLPYYVVGKNMEKNEVYVTTNLNDKGMWRRRIEVEQIHWIVNIPTGNSYLTRIRHRAALVEAELSLGETAHKGVLEFVEPQRATTPGQSVVFYRDDVCLGSAVVR